MKTETLAAIDIGSNAIRLLISSVDNNGGVSDFKKAAFLRVPIRLGEDVFTKGVISEEKRQLLVDALTGFSYIIRAYKVSRYRACATSAMRDAANGSEIVDYIKSHCNIDVEIISGQEEGDIIFEAGGLDKVMDRDRNYLYVDVGGGSTEIILYSNYQKLFSESFQLGTVRMLTDTVEKKSIIASGGNINKVHKILGKRDGEYIGATELKILYDAMKEMSYEERILNYKLKSYRADVIVPAMKIFSTICKSCKINEIYAPKVGLVDGIIHHIYYNR